MGNALVKEEREPRLAGDDPNRVAIIQSSFDGSSFFASEMMPARS
jgi:hypothetical protein